MQIKNYVARLDTVSRKGLTTLNGMEGLPHYYSYYYPSENIRRKKIKQ